MRLIIRDMNKIYKIIPLSLKEANTYVANYHRHHGKVQGYKFAVGAIDRNNELHGVAIAGRPVARFLDDGRTLEVTRLCTDGTINLCSFLYSACARIAKEMGYKKIITYILETEPGTSLRAAGWICTGKAGGQSWNNKCRKRNDNEYTFINKLRWEKE